MKELPFISEPNLPRKHCAPDYSIMNHFNSSSSEQNYAYHHLNTPKDYYRVRGESTDFEKEGRSMSATMVGRRRKL